VRMACVRVHVYIFVNSDACVFMTARYAIFRWRIAPARAVSSFSRCDSLAHLLPT
jgi:hypothetical protein